MATSPYDDAIEAARKLPAEQLARLIADLSGTLARELQSGEQRVVPRRSAYGVLAHLGPAPSAEEIDEARREAWANFPRDDIA